MVNLEVQRLLHQVILDYMSIRGLHQTRETFHREIFANQNFDAVNSSQEAFLQIWWGKFYETYNSVFPDFPIVDAKSLDKENVVANMESEILELLVKDSSVLRSFDELNDMDNILPFATNAGYGINLEGHTLMEPNMHDPANALPTLPEFLDTDQPMIAPTGRIMRSYEKQPVVQSGKKRKTPLSSLALVEKEAIVTGISIKEIHNFRATNIKLPCCHFNTQGEFLATAGHDRKVLIWELGNNNFSSIEGHTQGITDVRFRPNSTVFATSSLDKTVKIWDAAKPNKTYRNLAGHDGHVMSIDYHPTMVDLLSSCDHNNEIRLWDINMRDCLLILKGGSRQVRFQPQLGNLLASSTENIINIFDIETNSILKKLQGHTKNVRSICWDVTGNYLASVSDDSARIWSINEGMCIFELFSLENKFQSCIFHPKYCQTLVIGSNKFLELWNPIYQSNNVTSSYSAHDGIISSLADLPAKSIIASVSYDQLIKIWS